ncbi:cold-inducible protein YdjO-related protein [Priestia megaterium]|uniref:cold-inducible protein YdjO-related protein n=1 Tax=Priestia megaterium TaxID=1404 RepID=UPI0022818F8D|nr:cold-inducible protein YdjO-related protein [Priestia megaterium]
MSFLKGKLFRRNDVVKYYNHRKKGQEPLPKERTEIWEYQSEESNGWMRKTFSYENHQKCPLCGHKMRARERFLDESPNPH